MTIPEEHIDKLCRSKVVYKSRKSAEARIRAKRKRGFIISTNLRIYKCSFCFGFHLGHLKEYS